MRHIQLKTGRTLGPDFPTYLIAEIGSNHDGNLEKAKRLITLAREAGADAVKFQSFSAPTLLNPFAKTQEGWTPDPSYEMIKKVEIPLKWHEELALFAKEEGVDFLSTPFDLERLALLDQLDVAAIKIASGDLTYYDLLKAAAQTKRPLFLSTGHATLEEVQEAVAWLHRCGCTDLVLMHCLSSYPSSLFEANVRAMETLRVTFDVPVGYSDHSPGLMVPLAAVSLGAVVIEKHFTDNRNLPGADHAFALEPDQFSEMVEKIRMLEKALGNGEKVFQLSEEEERIMARRALYTAQEIPKGSIFQKEKLKVVRHAYPEGIAAKELDLVTGKKARERIPAHSLLTWEMVEP